MDSRTRTEIKNELVKILGEPHIETGEGKDTEWTWRKENGFCGKTETFTVIPDYADAHYTMSIGDTKIQGRAYLSELLGKASRCRQLQNK